MGPQQQQCEVEGTAAQWAHTTGAESTERAVDLRKIAVNTCGIATSFPVATHAIV